MLGGVMELPKGVFITMMPWPVAAGMSTLSTPMPARPDHPQPPVRRRDDLGRYFVADRIARPSYSPMMRRACSLSGPSFR
jgi:hypothetical protein